MKAHPRSTGINGTGFLLAFLLAWLAFASAGLAQNRTAPDFALDRWFNADTLSLSQLRGHPAVIMFFDAGDLRSLQAYPYIRQWYQKYQADSVAVLGIHCPAYRPLKDWSNAITAIARADLNLPVGMDMEGKVYKEYQLEGLPALVLLTPDSKIGFVTSDVSGYPEVEKRLQAMLKESDPNIVLPFLFEPRRKEAEPAAGALAATGRIELGYASGAVAHVDSSGLGKYVLYTDPGTREKGKVYLEGKWNVDDQGICCQEGETVHLRVVYSGKEVWLLPELPPDSAVRVYIEQDRAPLRAENWGKAIRADAVGVPYIYMRYGIPQHIVSNRVFGTHELELIPTQGGVCFHYLFFEGGPSR